MVRIVRASKFVGVGLLCSSLAAVAPAAAFVTFESGQVRPLALSPDGTPLFAVNTPDNRLEIFAVGGGGLTPRRLGAGRPRAGRGRGAARTARSGWSTTSPTASASSTSPPTPPRVVRTLLVGDEPRDIVFAGPASGDFTAPSSPPRTAARTRPGAAIAAVCARRGHRPRRRLGVRRRPTSAPRSAARRSRSSTLFGDTPRALAATPDGSTVYAAVFHSGNQTTAVSEGAVCDGGAGAPRAASTASAMPDGLPGGQVPGGLPAPNQNFEGDPGSGGRPDRQVQRRQRPLGGRARRATGPTRCASACPTSTSSRSTPTRATPVRAGAVRARRHGALQHGWSTRSAASVYVTNTEARNEVRFEGPGGARARTVRGHLHEARITVLDGAHRHCRAI